MARISVAATDTLVVRATALLHVFDLWKRLRTTRHRESEPGIGRRGLIRDDGARQHE
jgi:hypothetical protein